MKKIAFLMATPFTCGGEQRVVTKIANLFLEKDYEVSIICTCKSKHDYSLYGLNKNIEIIDLSKKSFLSKVFIRTNNKIRKINSHTRFLENFPELIKKIYFTPAFRKKIINTLNEKNFDYVVGVASEYSLFLATYKNEINSKIIGWQHSTYEAYFERKGRRMYGEKKLFTKYCHNFYRYVVLMNSDKNEIEKNFNIKCERIFNTLSFDSAEPSKLNNKKFIWFGRYNYIKGIDLLIDSYKKYREMGGTWDLELIGDGKLKENIIQLVKKYNLEKNITFIGFTKDIQKYLKEASILVFPSRYEGFGLTLTESMQHGLPAICYDLSPFREISEGYNSCIFVKTYDTITFAKEMLKLTNSPEQLKQMSMQALKNTEKFTGEKIISQWIDILENKE